MVCVSFSLCVYIKSQWKTKRHPPVPMTVTRSYLATSLLPALFHTGFPAVRNLRAGPCRVLNDPWRIECSNVWVWQWIVRWGSIFMCSSTPTAFPSLQTGTAFLEHLQGPCQSPLSVVEGEKMVCPPPFPATVLRAAGMTLDRIIYGSAHEIWQKDRPKECGCCGSQEHNSHI